MSTTSVISRSRSRGSHSRIRLGVSLMFGLAILQLARGSTWTVTSLADSGAGTLRQCIINSADDDEIVFATNGIITLTGGELAIGRNLTITGPGPKGLIVNGNNKSRVFNITSGPPVPAVNISGMTISNGCVLGEDFGALYAANAYGAGITNGGNLILSNCTVINNFARGGSGYAQGGNAAGGGIYNSGTLTLMACMVARNTAYGGGAQFETNLAGLGRGGGIDNRGAMVAINSTLFNNYAWGGTAGHTNYGNYCSGMGGAIANYGPLALTNCTLCSNYGLAGYCDEGGTSAQGGGIYGVSNSVATVTLVSCTICYNSVSAEGTGYAMGGGISVGSPLAMLNCLVAGDSVSGNSLGPDVYGSVDSLGHNLISVANDSSGWTASDQLGYKATPLGANLGPLQDNGGLTPTLRPAAGSAAIDRGTQAGLATDQRGMPRPVDMPGVANTADGCDIGAVETGYTFTSLNANGGRIFVDGPLPDFVPGSHALLYAVPVDGWAFTGWSGDATGANDPTSVLMDSDKSVTAAFVATVPDIIMDNTDATFTGSWSSGTILSGHDCYGLGDRYTVADGGADKAVYNFDMLTHKTGNYDFYTWYYTGAANTTNALYQLTFGGLLQSSRFYNVNQRVNCGGWSLVDTSVPLLGGMFGVAVVTVTNGFTYTGHNVVADAMKFSWSTNHDLVPYLKSVVATGSAQRAITWFAEPGASYRLQLKTNLTDAAWIDLPGDVTADDDTASKSDDTAGKTRFYRVMRL